MVIKLETTEKIRSIGNSQYVNVRKDFMDLLGLKIGDFVKITIEKIEDIKSRKIEHKEKKFKQ